MNVGDRVVCIDDSMVAFNSKNSNLTLYSIYNIIEIDKSFDEDSKYLIYSVYNDLGNLYGYYENRFITLKEYRRIKLERLNIKLHYGKLQ